MSTNFTNSFDKVLSQNPVFTKNITESFKEYWKEDPLSVIYLLLSLLLLALCGIAVIECIRAFKDNKRYTFQDYEPPGNGLPLHAMQ